MTGRPVVDLDDPYLAINPEALQRLVRDSGLTFKQLSEQLAAHGVQRGKTTLHRLATGQQATAPVSVLRALTEILT